MTVTPLTTKAASVPQGRQGRQGKFESHPPRLLRDHQVAGDAAIGANAGLSSGSMKDSRCIAVGSKVRANWKDEGKWFLGTVTRDHGNGTHPTLVFINVFIWYKYIDCLFGERLR